MRCGPSQRCHEGGSGGGGGGCAREDGSADFPAPNTDPGVCMCVCVGEWEGERGKDVIQELGVFLQRDW